MAGNVGFLVDPEYHKVMSIDSGTVFNEYFISPPYIIAFNAMGWNDKFENPKLLFFG